MENSIDTTWWYQGVPALTTDVPEWAVGMVYRIENMKDGRIYIGKKSLQSSTRKKIGIREKKSTGTRKTYKTTVKSSGWETYNSSNKVLAQEIAEHPQNYKKTILEWAYSKKNLHWLEMKYQFRYQVLETDSYNDNVGGRIWRIDVDKSKWDEHQQKLKEKREQKTTK
jgi:Putative endonuclease segE, GIY-YIG domain